MPEGPSLAQIELEQRKAALAAEFKALKRLSNVGGQLREIEKLVTEPTQYDFLLEEVEEFEEQADSQARALTERELFDVTGSFGKTELYWGEAEIFDPVDPRFCEEVARIRAQWGDEVEFRDMNGELTERWIGQDAGRLEIELDLRAKWRDKMGIESGSYQPPVQQDLIQGGGLIGGEFLKMNKRIDRVTRERAIDQADRIRRTTGDFVGDPSFLPSLGIERQMKDHIPQPRTEEDYTRKENVDHRAGPRPKTLAEQAEEDAK